MTLILSGNRMVEDGKRDVATKIAVAEKKAEAGAHAEDARRMKADGMDPNLISKYTGLSIADIDNL